MANTQTTRRGRSGRDSERARDEESEGREARNGARRGERQDRRDSSAMDGMHDHRTAKVVELVCCSRRSFEDAIRNGLKDAAETTRGITGCHVEGMSVRCEDGEITDFRVNLKIAFGVERTPAP